MFIRRLYAGYEQVVLQPARPINSRGRERGPVPELLVLSRGMASYAGRGEDP
jgi:hypothetical protein